MHVIQSIISIVFFSSLAIVSAAQDATVFSPDKQLRVDVSVKDGIPLYTILYNGKIMLEPSPLGFKCNEGDFSIGMKLLEKAEDKIDKNYTQEKIKKSRVHYVANKLTCTFENARQKKIGVIFQVSDNDVAFRYELPVWGERQSCVIEEETTGYKFPSFTTTFLSSMMTPMTGFARTAPSYESSYDSDAPITSAKKHKNGFVFPGLFRVGTNGWVLLSETGVGSGFCGSNLDNGNAEGLFKIGYPDIRQNNGFGSSGAAISLPGVGNA